MLFGFRNPRLPIGVYACTTWWQKSFNTNPDASLRRSSERSRFFESCCFLLLFHGKLIVQGRNGTVKDPFKSVGKQGKAIRSSLPIKFRWDWMLEEVGRFYAA